jgi:hypothetical protein
MSFLVVVWLVAGGGESSTTGEGGGESTTAGEGGGESTTTGEGGGGEGRGLGRGEGGCGTDGSTQLTSSAGAHSSKF